MRDPDDVTWVSLEPLYQDILKNLEKLERIDTNNLSKLDQDIMDFNIIGMKSIATFLDALIKEYDEKQSNQITH